MHTQVQGARVVCYLAAGLLVTWADYAEAQSVSDVFSSSSEYDRFAVGGAHRWYGNHSMEAQDKSSHCLSILHEAKTFQEKGLALDTEARRPGLDSHQATAIRKQANEQFRLRDKKIRAFVDCFNQANRQKDPHSDQFASSGAGTPNDHVKTPSPPSPNSGDGGNKGIKRLPGKPAATPGQPQPTAVEKAADECFSTSVPNYRSPDWVGYNRKARHPKPVGQVQPLFDTLGVAADQVLDLDEAVYGTWQDRELMRDYLIGWLTHCLTERKVFLRQDPRIPYRRHLEARAPSDLQTRTRLTRRFEEFGYGYRSYPLPPFWDHDIADPPAPGP